MTAAELGDRMSAAEFDRRMALERVRDEERAEAERQAG